MAYATPLIPSRDGLCLDSSRNRPSWEIQLQSTGGGGVDPEIILDINNLKTYFRTEQGIIRAVDGVSLRVRKGRTLGVVGESGCGKSVTALSIMQLLPRPKGRIVGGCIMYQKRDGTWVHITAFDPNGDEIRSIRGNEIAMIFQEPMTSLNPVFSIGEQIMEAIQLHQKVSKLEAKERAISMLAKVGIPAPDRLVNAYPHQFSGGMRVIDSNDFSTYHALEIQIERRFSGGLGYQASYTWAKSLDTRSYDPAFTVVSTGTAQSASSTPFDIYNRRLNYARSDFDRAHVVQSNWIWELPFGRTRKWATRMPAPLEAVLGGWQVTGYLRLTSGRPFTVYSGSYTFGSLQQSPANCRGCDRSLGRLYDDAASGLKWYLNESARAKFSIPEPGEMGNTGRNFLEGPGFFNMDLAVLKRIGLGPENWYLELRGDFTNLTNSPSFGFPTAVITSTIFGRVRDSVVSGWRKIQLGAKIYF